MPIHAVLLGRVRRERQREGPVGTRTHLCTNATSLPRPRPCAADRHTRCASGVDGEPAALLEVVVDLVLLVEPVDALVVGRGDGGGALALGRAVVVEGLARVGGEAEERDLAAELPRGDGRGMRCT